jgi:hypothetical protein
MGLRQELELESMGGASGTTAKIYSDYLSGSDINLHLSTYSHNNDAGGITISTNGSVGIGTATISSNTKLEVNGNIMLPNNTDIRTKFNNGTIRQAILLGTDDLWRIAERKDGTAFSLVATSTGNVGIGTNSPGSDKLKVIGTATADTLAGDNIRVGIDPYSMYITQDSLTYGGSSYACDIGHFVKIINNPMNTIHVDGAIYTTSITADSVVADKVCINNWTIEAPDYVFSSSYKIPKLPELEKFIQKNKHLPEVPSAKEMKKNGVDLAEMNMLLLKKVEEMTLLMIEQEKRIKHLEQNAGINN